MDINIVKTEFKKRKILLAIFGVLLVLILLVLLIYFFVGRVVRVNGASMMPNYKVGQYLFVVSSPSYKPGDVVAYNFTSSPGKNHLLVKRVIGVPGDVVMILFNKVYINRKILDEAAYNVPAQTKPGSIFKNGISFKVPSDSYFLLGDDRARSNDSRNLGFIKESSIIGKEAFCIWKCGK
jgi:signal peptidase I